MHNELVKASPVYVLAPCASQELPSLVERAGGAACFAWDEFFDAEHHSAHTQKAYLQAVKRFMAWAEGQGVELAAITPHSRPSTMIGAASDELMPAWRAPTPIGPEAESA